jgi:hypothetical protein
MFVLHSPSLQLQLPLGLQLIHPYLWLTYLLKQTSNLQRIEVKLAGGRLPTEGRVMVRLHENDESESYFIKNVLSEPFFTTLPHVLFCLLLSTSSVSQNKWQIEKKDEKEKK